MLPSQTADWTAGTEVPACVVPPWPEHLKAKEGREEGREEKEEGREEKEEGSEGGREGGKEGGKEGRKEIETEVGEGDRGRGERRRKSSVLFHPTF